MTKQSNRRCGPCSACCTVLGVPSLGKPSHTACEHCKPGWKACQIYDGRPDECAAFSCMWVDGHFGSKDRPDDIGCVFQATELSDIPTYALICHEVRRDASASGRAAAIIERTSKKIPVFIVPFDNGNCRLVCANSVLAAKLSAKLRNIAT